ncbi:MAG: hypothetical protein IH878_09115 [Gemmatimonadetes bacterium]|nr:hypothetical protein [Gemmatimonadota bacterium]
MKKWIRKLRGIVGMGALWGVGGAAFGAVVAGLEGMFLGTPIFASMFDLASTLGFFGFLTGSGFATVLAAFEGRRTIGELSTVRAALWGGVAGAALPAVALFIQRGWPGLIAVISDPQHSFLMASILSGIVPAVLASGTVFLARRSSAELPAGGAKIADPVLELPTKS